MFKDLVKKNRSYRAYNEKRKVTREEILDILDCARFTASTGNIQALKFYAANAWEETEAILACTKWAAALPELGLPVPGTHPTAFVVVLQDRSIDENMARFQPDCGVAGQTITLAAAEKGLGGLIIRNFNAGALKTALQLPENLVPMMVIALGEPAEEVSLEEVGPDGKTAYYRTDGNRHHQVPKRSLSELVISGGLV